jgi:hypothetical protein
MIRFVDFLPGTAGTKGFSAGALPFVNWQELLLLYLSKWGRLASDPPSSQSLMCNYCGFTSDF